MRTVGARSIVDRIHAGATPEEACIELLRDAASLPDRFRAELRTLALTPDGRHGAAASQNGAYYAVMTEIDAEPQILPRATA